MTTQPFFDEKLLRCDPRGNHPELSGGKRVKFFEDRVALDETAIYYVFLTKLAAVENVLHIGYLVADGTVVQEYLRLDGLSKARASARLQEAIATALAHQGSIAPSVIAEARARLADKPVIASSSSSPDGRFLVQVRDPVVLFPLVCPNCVEGATTVDVLHAAKGLGEKAAWVVPTCDRHPKIGDSIRLTRWSVSETGYEFSFLNSTYAELFCQINQGEPSRGVSTASTLPWEINRGTRFVVFQWAFSALAVGLISTSKVHKIEPGMNAGRFARRYTVFSSLFGWWSLGGPFFTVAAIRGNAKGGIDLTPSVAALVAGSRVAPRRIG